MARKLINWGSPGFNYSDDPCIYFCDPTKNDSGFCAPLCSAICPPNCPHSLSFLTPAPDSMNLLHPIKQHHLSPLLISLLTILASAFLLSLFYVIYSKFSASRRRAILSQNSHEEHGPAVDNPIWYITTVGLHPSVIESITVWKYKRDQGIVEGTDCAVCLNEFQEDESLRLLPKCNHAFHVHCIDTWLGSRTNCPVCRAPVVSSVATATSNSNGEDRHRHVRSPEEDGQVGGDLGIGESGETVRKLIRRTVSVDFVGTYSFDLVQQREEVCGEEIMPGDSSSTSMKRSMSCNGKFF